LVAEEPALLILPLPTLAVPAPFTEFAKSPVDGPDSIESTASLGGYLRIRLILIKNDLKVPPAEALLEVTV